MFYNKCENELCNKAIACPNCGYAPPTHAHLEPKPNLDLTNYGTQVGTAIPYSILAWIRSGFIGITADSHGTFVLSCIKLY